MIFHLFFIGLYLLFRDISSGEYVNYIFIIHCAIGIIINVFKKRSFISPIVVFYAASIFATVGNIDVIGNIGKSKAGGYAYIVTRFIPEANLIWTVGCSVVFIGWELFTNVSLPAVEYGLSKKNIDKYFRITVAFAVLMPIIGSSLAFLGSLLKLFSLIGLIGILFYSRLWAVEGSAKYRRYTVILFLIQTWVALNYSYLRAELITPAVILIMGYVIGKGNIKSMLSAKMVPFIVVIIAFASIFGELGKYRSEFGSAIVNRYVFGDEGPKPELFGEEEGQQLGLLDRSASVAQLTNIEKLVENNGFYDGAASAPILLALIPRFLWPDKPQIQLGAWFAVEIGVAYKEKGGMANNSVNMTVPGELYLDFGWFGILIGCLLYGGIVSSMWNSLRFYENEYNILGVIMGGYMLLNAFYGLNADLQLLVTYASVYLIFYTMNVVLPLIIKE